ncbi:hypothetical protein [Kineococcus sp. SYSU DK005]|uniref:hypothetical protein n=1 Tax=Kineococcus sp. SYSU DK005 TaxID=3383126 RepID=UPI003D7CC160
MSGPPPWPLPPGLRRALVIVYGVLAVGGAVVLLVRGVQHGDALLLVLAVVNVLFWGGLLALVLHVDARRRRRWARYEDGQR